MAAAAATSLGKVTSACPKPTTAPQLDNVSVLDRSIASRPPFGAPTVAAERIRFQCECIDNMPLN